MSRIDELKERYMAAAHAVQSGVAMDHGRGGTDGSPKHLRTGINMAMSDHAALAQLCMKKGVFTEEEYFEALVESAEREKASYEERLSESLGTKVTLG